MRAMLDLNDPSRLRTPVAGPRFARWLDDIRDDVPVPSSPEAGAADPSSVIPFGWGVPAPDLYPRDALERAYRSVMQCDWARALEYSDSEGTRALRTTVAARAARRGIQVDVDQVVITSGSLQGLDLVGRTLLDDGDTIAVEAPTFMGALGVWRPYRPRFLQIPLDGASGMDLDVLEAALRSGARPKLVYALPSFQNPTGALMPEAKRARLLRLAREYDFCIVEDDPYGELYYDAVTPLPVRALPGADEHVIYLGSFSKILAPGLRLGYAIASRRVAHRFTLTKKGMDFHTDGVTQLAAVRLIEDPELDFERYVASLRRAYAERRDALLDALARQIGSPARWTRPEGGFFVWLELGEPIDGPRLARAGPRHGVSLLAGQEFFPGGQAGRDAVRLSFSCPRADQMAEGVARIRAAIEDARA